MTLKRSRYPKGSEVRWQRNDVCWSGAKIERALTEDAIMDYTRALRIEAASFLTLLTGLFGYKPPHIN